MQPIRIFTPSLDFLGEIDDYRSLQFERKSKESGQFEIQINLNKENTEHLKEDNLIYLNDHRVGIIRKREIKRDELENLIIKGYELKSILSRRITIPPTGQAYDTVRGPIETLMKHYVLENAVNPTDSTRMIPNLVIAEDLGRGPEVDHSSRYKQLDQELANLSTDEIGWEIYVDLENRKYIFDVIAGKNRTVNQTIHPPVIFSIDFDNIKNQTFVESTMDYKNTAYVGGQGEGEQRAIAEVGTNASGFDRIETFVDARDVEDDALLSIRGAAKLKEFEKVVSFESEILTNGPFVYRQDWDLGDAVTVQDNKLNLTMDTPIPAITEFYEENGFSVDATFGKVVPTILDKYNQKLSGPMTEKAIIPSKISELQNDAGYITESEIGNIVSDKSYSHEQLVPTTDWTILHNLGKYPSVTVIDSAGSTVMGDIKNESLNKLIISFATSFAGKAICN